MLWLGLSKNQPLTCRILRAVIDIASERHSTIRAIFEVSVGTSKRERHLREWRDGTASDVQGGERACQPRVHSGCIHTGRAVVMVTAPRFSSHASTLIAQKVAPCV